MADYNTALSLPISWSVKDNTYDDKDRNPKTMSLFVPLEAAHEFAQHLMNLADSTEKHRSGKSWDFSKNEAREVQGFYINAKGKSGQYGDYGNINPAKVETPCSTGNCPVPSSNSELPF